MTIALAHRLAPAIAAVLLVIFLFGLRASSGPSGAELDAYFAEVKAEVEQVPWLIGSYVGRENEVAPSAEELLKPNAILQRTYIDTNTNTSFSLVLIHSGVARDMQGHFPPNCYPAHGWDGGAVGDVAIDLAGADRTARVYNYTRTLEVRDESVNILNLFATPNQETPFGRDMGVIDRASRSRFGNQMGAAQVQVLTPPAMPQEQREQIWAMAMEAVGPAMARVAGGVGEPIANPVAAPTAERVSEEAAPKESR